MIEVLSDALIDSLKVLPFLILVYILIEVLEHTTTSEISSKLLRGKLSPLIGAGVGAIPQCGFSVMATKLYTNRSIALGTLLAVYISTSDEAFAVLISDFSIEKLLPLLIIKVVYAIIVGYAVNFFVRRRSLADAQEHISAVGCHHHIVGRDDECGHCHDEGGDQDDKKIYRRNAVKRFLVHPLLHSLTTFVFIFAVNFALGTIIYYVGQDSLAAFMSKIGFLQPVLAAIVGLIPNCAASVVIAQMYVLGTLSLGAALSGLSVSAGIGLAVLVKENGSVKDTLLVIGLLLILSIALGMAVTGISMLF